MSLYDRKLISKKIYHNIWYAPTKSVLKFQAAVIDGCREIFDEKFV